MELHQNLFKTDTKCLLFRQVGGYAKGSVFRDNGNLSGFCGAEDVAAGL